MGQIVSDTAIFAISPSKFLLTTSVWCVVRVCGTVWALVINQKMSAKISIIPWLRRRVRLSWRGRRLLLLLLICVSRLLCGIMRILSLLSICIRRSGGSGPTLALSLVVCGSITLWLSISSWGWLVCVGRLCCITRVSGLGRISSSLLLLLRLCIISGAWGGGGCGCGCCGSIVLPRLMCSGILICH